MRIAAVLGIVVGLALGATLSGDLSDARAQGGCNGEWWTGTSAANTRYDDGDGDWEDNHWFFLEGNDFGRSLDCNDSEIRGDFGADDIGGGSDVDWLWGDANNDFVYGGAGGDQLEGNNGSDLVKDEQGSDLDFANGGVADGDTVHVQDNDTFDQASGGDGTNDECIVDSAGEKSGGCER